MKQLEIPTSKSVLIYPYYKDQQAFINLSKRFYDLLIKHMSIEDCDSHHYYNFFGYLDDPEKNSLINPWGGYATWLIPISQLIFDIDLIPNKKSIFPKLDSPQLRELSIIYSQMKDDLNTQKDSIDEKKLYLYLAQRLGLFIIYRCFRIDPDKCDDYITQELDKNIIFLENAKRILVKIKQKSESDQKIEVTLSKISDWMLQAKRSYQPKRNNEFEEKKESHKLRNLVQSLKKLYLEAHPMLDELILHLFNPISLIEYDQSNLDQFLTAKTTAKVNTGKLNKQALLEQVECYIEESKGVATLYFLDRDGQTIRSEELTDNETKRFKNEKKLLSWNTHYSETIRSIIQEKGGLPTIDSKPTSLVKPSYAAFKQTIAGRQLEQLLRMKKRGNIFSSIFTEKQIEYCVKNPDSAGIDSFLIANIDMLKIFIDLYKYSACTNTMDCKLDQIHTEIVNHDALSQRVDILWSHKQTLTGYLRFIKALIENCSLLEDFLKGEINTEVALVQNRLKISLGGYITKLESIRDRLWDIAYAMGRVRPLTVDKSVYQIGITLNQAIEYDCDIENFAKNNESKKDSEEGRNFQSEQLETQVITKNESPIDSGVVESVKQRLSSETLDDIHALVQYFGCVPKILDASIRYMTIHQYSIKCYIELWEESLWNLNDEDAIANLLLEDENDEQKLNLMSLWGGEIQTLPHQKTKQLLLLLAYLSNPIDRCMLSRLLGDSNNPLMTKVELNECLQQLKSSRLVKYTKSQVYINPFLQWLLITKYDTSDYKHLYIAIDQINLVNNSWSMISPYIESFIREILIKQWEQEIKVIEQNEVVSISNLFPQIFSLQAKVSACIKYASGCHKDELKESLVSLNQRLHEIGHSKLRRQFNRLRFNQSDFFKVQIPEKEVLEEIINVADNLLNLSFIQDHPFYERDICLVKELILCLQGLEMSEETNESSDVITIAEKHEKFLSLEDKLKLDELIELKKLYCLYRLSSVEKGIADSSIKLIMEGKGNLIKGILFGERLNYKILRQKSEYQIYCADLSYLNAFSKINRAYVSQVNDYAESKSNSTSDKITDITVSVSELREMQGNLVNQEPFENIDTLENMEESLSRKASIEYGSFLTLMIADLLKIPPDHACLEHRPEQPISDTKLVNSIELIQKLNDKQQDLDSRIKTLKVKLNENNEVKQKILTEGFKLESALEKTKSDKKLSDLYHALNKYKTFCQNNQSEPEINIIRLYETFQEYLCYKPLRSAYSNALHENYKENLLIILFEKLKLNNRISTSYLESMKLLIQLSYSVFHRYYDKQSFFSYLREFSQQINTTKAGDYLLVLNIYRVCFEAVAFMTAQFYEQANCLRMLSPDHQIDDTLDKVVKDLISYADRIVGQINSLNKYQRNGNFLWREYWDTSWPAERIERCIQLSEYLSCVGRLIDLYEASLENSSCNSVIGILSEYQKSLGYRVRSSRYNSKLNTHQHLEDIKLLKQQCSILLDNEDHKEWEEKVRSDVKKFKVNQLGAYMEIKKAEENAEKFKQEMEQVVRESRKTDITRYCKIRKRYNKSPNDDELLQDLEEESQFLMNRYNLSPTSLDTYYETYLKNTSHVSQGLFRNKENPNMNPEQNDKLEEMDESDSSYASCNN